MRAWLTESHINMDIDTRVHMDRRVDSVSQSGGTPLVVAVRTPDHSGKVLGVVYLKDIVKEGLTDRFAELRRMGIRTVMVTGDNPLTAAAIAKEAGVDDFLAEATPEDKLAYIRKEQEGGRMVAMTGDGTNDAPALAQADVGVAMNTGTSAAKEAGNMVDLDSDPTKLISIVGIGKQLLITRGALTTFSIANDIAKYFAIIPAIFMRPTRVCRPSTLWVCIPRRQRCSRRSSLTLSSSLFWFRWPSKAWHTSPPERRKSSHGTCASTGWAVLLRRSSASGLST
ncbi:potassium-transporting ATPase [Cutibacterium acnes JCM 18920]|nr:potassium-transporting ATPase [Cutibacterium acnes JCM 18920]